MTFAHWVILLGLLLQGVAHPVTFVIDDSHPASAMIAGYRWNLNGVRYSTKVTKKPPCVDCLERTYNLPPGMHTLVVTPYNSKGDILADAVSYDVLVDVTGDATEQNIYLQLTEKPKGSAR